MKKTILIFAVIILFMTAAVLGSIYLKRKTPEPKPSETLPTAQPFWELESYQTAKNKVIFKLPYKKDSINIEYSPKAQIIVVSIQARDMETYRKSKLEAEKYFDQFNVDLCELHLSWYPDIAANKNLIQSDLTTTGCQPG